MAKDAWRDAHAYWDSHHLLLNFRLPTLLSGCANLHGYLRLYSLCCSSIVIRWHSYYLCGKCNAVAYGEKVLTQATASEEAEKIKLLEEALAIFLPPLECLVQAHVIYDALDRLAQDVKLYKFLPSKEQTSVLTGLLRESLQA